MKKIIEMNVMNLKSAVEMLMENENVDYFTDKTEHLQEVICNSIDKQLYLDVNYKYELENKIVDLMCYSSQDGFRIGFEMGVSLLKNLLSAESPVIRTEPKVEREPLLPSNVGAMFITNHDKEFIDYIARSIPLLSDMQKGKLQGRIETMLHSQRIQVKE